MLVCLLFILHFVVDMIMHGYNTVEHHVEHSVTGTNNRTGVTIQSLSSNTNIVLNNFNS